MVEWQNGQVVENEYDEIGYALVNGQECPVYVKKIDGNTPLTAENMNQMEQDLLGFKYILKIQETGTAGAQITLPAYYKVGVDVLEVYLNGEKLIKTVSSDSIGTNGHYYEYGNTGDIVNTIHITTDWNLNIDDVLEFVIKGEYE